MRLQWEISELSSGRLGPALCRLSGKHWGPSLRTLQGRLLHGGGGTELYTLPLQPHRWEYTTYLSLWHTTCSEKERFFYFDRCWTFQLVTFPPGSTSATCDSRGRCTCKEGVTGEKCNRCPEGPIGPNGCLQRWGVTLFRSTDTIISYIHCLCNGYRTHQVLSALQINLLAL